MPDADLDAIIAAGPRPSGKECATGWSLQRLDPDTAAKFRLAMSYNADEGDLHEAFKARGLPWATPTSIGRHAKGACRNCADRASA